jgi:[protein-PII] uridylyltransferase
LVAAHGYRLTQNAEDRLADALPVLDVHIPEGPFLWNGLREILLGPHAAHALRTMHALGILELLIPEFHGIDALVIPIIATRSTSIPFWSSTTFMPCASRT